MRELAGKVAVITGGASGIGFAMAERFAAEAMALVLADIEAESLRQAVERVRERGVEAIGVVCDVSDLDSVRSLADRAVSRFGAVHVLCNNAGVGGGGRITTLTMDDWRWVLGVDLWGVIHGVQVFLPILEGHGEPAHIVNTASLAGLIGGTSAPYNVAKAAVVSLSETMYRDLAITGSNVGVSVLCPAFVRTRIAESERNRPAALRDTVSVPGTPEHRFVSRQVERGGDPADIAAAVLDAVRNDRFWVLPHPEADRFIAERTETMLARRNPVIPNRGR